VRDGTSHIVADLYGVGAELDPIVDQEAERSERPNDGEVCQVTELCAVLEKCIWNERGWSD